MITRARISFSHRVANVVHLMCVGRNEKLKQKKKRKYFISRVYLRRCSSRPRVVVCLCTSVYHDKYNESAEKKKRKIGSVERIGRTICKKKKKKKKKCRIHSVRSFVCFLSLSILKLTVTWSSIPSFLPNYLTIIRRINKIGLFTYSPISD